MKAHVGRRPTNEDAPPGATDPRRSRPQVLVLLERPSPSRDALRSVAWLALRLRAEVLVAGMLVRQAGLDELELARINAAEAAVEDAVRQLRREGVAAIGEVHDARPGQEGPAADDLSDRLDADLVVVLARRGSWLGLLPGSRLAHHLMRARRRPVIVVPDRAPAPGWVARTRSLVGAGSTLD